AIYPEVFPIRNTDKPPIPLKYRLGYFCIDNYAPVSRNAITAAREAVDCAVTGAAHIVGDDDLAYALVRPPGHHAEAGFLGGFCYLNSAAVATEYLSDYGRTAVLDIDFHHGNGTQSIFYHRPDVLTVSIHGDPRYAFPHFAGFQSETGEGRGRGFNVNIPLPEQIEAADYMAALTRALGRIQRFRPEYLVISLGLDTARADPTGTWPLRAGDFEMIGRQIGALKRPTLIVQEGGYRTRTLGVNARRFFLGLWETH
nr:histone deacetylase family protein [bacterium]